MGLFSKKKPTEVEATTKKKASKRSSTSKGNTQLNIPQEQTTPAPEVIVQLSGSEMYIANMLADFKSELKNDILDLKKNLEDLQELISSHL